MRRRCAGELRPRGRAGEDGRKKDGRTGAQRWRNLAGRARRLAGRRAGESRRLAGLLVGEREHEASWPATQPSTAVSRASMPPRGLPHGRAPPPRGRARAWGKKARGELTEDWGSQAAPYPWCETATPCGWDEEIRRGERKGDKKMKNITHRLAAIIDQCGDGIFLSAVTLLSELILEDMLATLNRRWLSQHDTVTRETIIQRFEYDLA